MQAAQQQAAHQRTAHAAEQSGTLLLPAVGCARQAGFAAAASSSARWAQRVQARFALAQVPGRYAVPRLPKPPPPAGTPGISLVDSAERNRQSDDEYRGNPAETGKNSGMQTISSCVSCDISPRIWGKRSAI